MRKPLMFNKVLLLLMNWPTILILTYIHSLKWHIINGMLIAYIARNKGSVKSTTNLLIIHYELNSVYTIM